MATEVDEAGSTHLAFFADLVRCETRLYNQFNEELRALHGIVTSQYELLRFIRDHERSRVTDLATEFAIGVGAVSKAMDRLEARGMVTRLPNPANRRSTMLALTEDGRDIIDSADATFQTRLAEILTQAGTPAQIAAAASMLSRLRAALELGGLGTPAG
jgi:DNA-binding MarR family transcriptional regulator